MDGMHDLGGMQGFGRIETQLEYVPFAAPWEGRMWALAQNLRTDWTIDWFRHLIELIDPPNYLRMPYFEKWFMACATGLVASGMLDPEEIIASKGSGHAGKAKTADLDAVLETARNRCHSFERTVDEEPAFAVGQQVRAKSHGHSGHTRLPAYARGRRGKITAQRGAHVFPDTNVDGVEAPQHLYTVKFAARELWGAEASPVDVVQVDLWESYLVPA